MAAPATRRCVCSTICAYPGNVHIIVSGTAASAGDSAGDSSGPSGNDARLAVDDPRPVGGRVGNERDLEEAVRLLRACKESILNVYGQRCRRPREEIKRHDARYDMDGRAPRCATGSSTASWTWAAARSTPPPATKQPRGGQGKGGGMGLERTRPYFRCAKPRAQPAATVKRNPYKRRCNGLPNRRTSGQSAGSPCAPASPAAQLRRRLELITPTSTLMTGGNLMNHEIQAMREKRRGGLGQGKGSSSTNIRMRTVCSRRRTRRSTSAWNRSGRPRPRHRARGARRPDGAGTERPRRWRRWPPGRRPA